MDLERQRARLEEERQSFEIQISSLRETMDQMVIAIPLVQEGQPLIFVTTANG